MSEKWTEMQGVCVSDIQVSKLPFSHSPGLYWAASRCFIIGTSCWILLAGRVCLTDISSLSFLSWRRLISILNGLVLSGAERRPACHGMVLTSHLLQVEWGAVSDVPSWERPPRGLDAIVPPLPFRLVTQYLHPEGKQCGYFQWNIVKIRKEKYFSLLADDYIGNSLQSDVHSCCTNFTRRTYSKNEIKDLSAKKKIFYCLLRANKFAWGEFSQMYFQHQYLGSKLGVLGSTSVLQDPTHK